MPMNKREYKPYDVEVSTLGFYIDRLLYAMIKRRNQDLKESQSDLQHSEFIVLKVLNLLEGASQSDLAKVMGKERSGVSRTLASLEKKGYIKRTSVNGKTNSVTLTEKAKEYIPEINRLSEKLTECAFKGFSQKKRESLLKTLDKVYKNTIGY